MTETITVKWKAKATINEFSSVHQVKRYTETILTDSTIEISGDKILAIHASGKIEVVGTIIQ